MFRKRRRSDDDFREEIEAHIDLEAERLAGEGLDPDEARRAAHRTFGNVTRSRERFYESRRFVWLDQLLQDLRYAARSIRKNPGFSAVVILTLAGGSGANTAIFSLIDAVLLKSLPVDSPDELFLVAKTDSVRFTGFSYPVFQDFRDAAGEVAEVFAAGGSGPWEVRFEEPTGRAAPERVMGELVSGTFFSTLGVNAAVGRVLTADDARHRGGHPVAVLSHRFWTRRFGNDPVVLGRVIVIHGTAFTVVGVAEAGFLGINPGWAPDVWAPMIMQSQVSPGISTLDSYRHNWLRIMGRPKPGASREQAEAAIGLRFRRFLEEGAPSIENRLSRERYLGQRVELEDGRAGIDYLRRMFSLPLHLLMAAVGLVLLIACANVASLLLARATVRQRETSVRLALGAGRARLIRQWLTESLLLAGLAALLAVGFAQAGAQALVGLIQLGPHGLVFDVRLDLRLLVFTAAVAVLAAILFGLAPALRAGRTDLRGALASTAASVFSPRRGLAGRRTLAVLEIALSLVLAIGAGLFLRTVYNLETLDSGFDRRNVLLAAVSPRDAGYKHPGRTVAGEEEARAALNKLSTLYSELHRRFEVIPGVESSTWSACGLLMGCKNTKGDIRAQGFTPAPDEDLNIRYNAVGPRYFETTGMRLLAGRDFTARDNLSAPLVAIVNETAARHYFGSGNPVGRRFHIGEDSRYQIVGMVRDARQDGPRSETPPFFYFAQLQDPTDNATFVFRTAGEPRALTGQITQTLKETDSRLYAVSMTTLDEAMNTQIAQERLLAQLSTLFGLLALAVTCVGLYGLMAYSVARRTNEIGLRMALGAQRSEIVRAVLGETLRLAALGVALGVIGALAAMRLTESLLFGLAPTDPLTIAAAVVVMIVVAALAAWVPALRAARIDPMSALRYE